MKLFLFTVILFFSACQFEFRKEDKRVKALNEMQQTDVDFSNFSKEKGIRKAFLEYMEDDGVLLRPDHLPIIGADAIEFLSSMNDSLIELTWEPHGGDVSETGDMGYTYGVYTLKDSENFSKGTYVTIWRKQKDETWKFVLDTGNQGIGEVESE
jgi:ketosteroid isomerase-like protein